jgi:hypothetical protein
MSLVGTKKIKTETRFLVYLCVLSGSGSLHQPQIQRYTKGKSTHEDRLS